MKTQQKNDIERISEEDFLEINKAEKNTVITKLSFEKAEAIDRAAELSLRNLILQAYVKYGLSEKDRIHNDGTIVRYKAETNDKKEDVK